MSNGFSVIVCKGWCRHILNPLDLKWLPIHRSSRWLLVSIGRNGMVIGIDGVGWVLVSEMENHVATDVGASGKTLIIKNQTCWLTHAPSVNSRVKSYSHEQHNLYMKLVVCGVTYLLAQYTRLCTWIVLIFLVHLKNFENLYRSQTGFTAPIWSATLTDGTGRETFRLVFE